MSNQQNNKQNVAFKQNLPNKSSTPNRPGMPNRPGPRFNGQKTPGIRKPVSPNELLQLQKTIKSDNGKSEYNTAPLS